jgi:hypothetical protein
MKQSIFLCICDPIHIPFFVWPIFFSRMKKGKWTRSYKKGNGTWNAQFNQTVDLILGHMNCTFYCGPDIAML